MATRPQLSLTMGQNMIITYGHKISAKFDNGPNVTNTYVHKISVEFENGLKNSAEILWPQIYFGYDCLENITSLNHVHKIITMWMKDNTSTG